MVNEGSFVPADIPEPEMTVRLSAAGCRSDGTTYQKTGVAPDYWMQTGVVELYVKSMTGGTKVAALGLAPGTHALSCTNEENAFWQLTDISITP